MATSYDTWKADFDAYCTNYLSLFCPDTSHDSSSAANNNKHHDTLRQEFLTFTTANAAIYHAAHILLNAEFLDLQIYAGARHILGRPVGRADHVRSQRVVKRWAATTTSGATTAAVHAARLIGDGVGQGFDAPGVFHYPWCLYLATLTCWAWWHARPSGGGGGNAEVEGGGEKRRRRHRRVRVDEEGDDDDDVPWGEEDEGSDEDEDEMVWDAGRELDALVACMTSSMETSTRAAEQERLETVARSMRPAVVRRRIGGLTAVVARQLGKVRWAVVHDGMMVLRGLVPWRMIGGASLVDGGVVAGGGV